MATCLRCWALALFFAAPQLCAQDVLFNPGPVVEGSTAAKLDMPGTPRFEPFFGVEVGWLALSRSADESYPLVFTDGTMGPVETIATSEIVSTEANDGYRLAFNFYNLCVNHVPGLDFELVFSKVNRMTGEAVVSAEGNNTTDVIPVFFSGIPASPVDSNTFTLVSNLRTAEFSMGYRPMERLRFLMGFRWIEVREDFDIVDTATVGTTTLSGFFSEATNDAFGFQIGGETTLLTNGIWRVYSSGKIAWLRNNIGGDAISSNFTINFDDEVDSTLYDFEVGVSGRIAHWALLQVAYQGLWLRDAASVMNQSRDLSIVGSNDQTPTLGRINFNGFRFDLVAIW